MTTGNLLNRIKNSQTRFCWIVFLCMPILLSSCAPVRHPGPGLLPSSGAALLPPTVIPLPIPRQDITHIVGPGETLWRISKMYDVPAQSITNANHLSSQPVLKKGARLVIPRAAPVQPVISLYPSQRWTHIIIHHSATDEGDSLLFDKAHLNKGWDGVGYHFIIDNGSKDRRDGQVEVSPRWLKQVPGAHCKADGMNERAIGICLVGNFNHGRPSAAQMNALIELVKKLKDYYKISRGHITGHGKVDGAQTDCPGKKFPWDSFTRRLDDQ